MSSLKIISLNIELDKHLDLVIPFFKKENADVLLLQEVLEEKLELFRKKLEMDYVFVPLANIHFSQEIKTLGMASFSKRNIIKSKITYYLGTHDVIPVCDRTEPEKINRAILAIWISKNSQEFCFVNTHFTWAPDGGPNLRQRQDLKKLFRLLTPLKEFVLAGDFNAPRGREIFDTLSEVYKNNIPENITTTIDKNLHYAGDLQIVIDGLFTTSGYKAKGVRVINGISDHCAVAANIYKM